MKKGMWVIWIVLFAIMANGQAEKNIRKIATWNMKWLGTNSGNQLDAVENVPLYADYIAKTGATLFALQEIGATHSENGRPRCYYLDEIVKVLNQSIADSSDQWIYIQDSTNKQQRLAYLYRKDHWNLSEPVSIYPGYSFAQIRRPLLTTVEAVGPNAELKLNFINMHLKAFNDSTSREKRRNNFDELAIWLETHMLDEDVLLAGDTNLYYGESEIYQALKDIHYKYLYDNEVTSIHEDELSQCFDRFFTSPDLLKEIDSAKQSVGNTDVIDVIKDNDPEKIIWFDQNLSDHYAVVLCIDVSEER
jgi:endonuclease/exonuclease/phosphatase family metal-dependent hydrolase